MIFFIIKICFDIINNLKIYKKTNFKLKNLKLFKNRLNPLYQSYLIKRLIMVIEDPMNLN